MLGEFYTLLLAILIIFNILHGDIKEIEKKKRLMLQRLGSRESLITLASIRIKYIPSCKGQGGD